LKPFQEMLTPFTAVHKLPELLVEWETPEQLIHEYTTETPQPCSQEN